MPILDAIWLYQVWLIKNGLYQSENQYEKWFSKWKKFKKSWIVCDPRCEFEATDYSLFNIRFRQCSLYLFVIKCFQFGSFQNTFSNRQLDTFSKSLKNIESKKKRNLNTYPSPIINLCNTIKILWQFYEKIIYFVSLKYWEFECSHPIFGFIMI